LCLIRIDENIGGYMQRLFLPALRMGLPTAENSARLAASQREVRMLSHAIHVRKPALDFEKPIERFYFDQDPVKTHIFNALNLLFPEGERFFVKSVHRYQQQITQPELLQQMREFAGQEGQHAHQHERFFSVMKRQGYRIGGFLRYFADNCKGSSKKLPPALNLAITAGSEHYTAVLAAAILDSGLLERCDATMRDLITWHAVEEIEHKHVAFDVLREVQPHNYPLRVGGFLLATWSLSAHTAYAFNMLMQQDLAAGRVDRAQVAAGRRQLLRGQELKFLRTALVGLLKYLKPGFHPADQDDAELLAQFAPLVPLVNAAA
jgi:predicted metal-dependent hydrolase